MLPSLIKLVAARGFEASYAARIFKPHATDVSRQLVQELEGKTIEEQADLVSTLAYLQPDSMSAVIAAFDNPSPSIRIGAAAVAAAIGRKAPIAVPGLLRLTHDQDAAIRMNAIEALVRVDDRREHLAKWLPAVAAAVREMNSPEQRRAAAILRTLGRDAKEAAPALLTAMAESSGPLRVEMAVALARIDHRQGPQALPVLLEALNDPALPASAMVVMAIGELGPPAKAALPALHRMFEERTVAMSMSA